MDIRTLVNPPSIGALAYQAHALVQELHSITNEEYPKEAVSIKYLLIAIADYLQDELHVLQKLSPIDDLDYKRARALGAVIHSIYSFISHLRESSPLQSPPALQETLSCLTKLYFPNAEFTNPICVIQPKWEYNFEYIPLIWRLIDCIEPTELDPHCYISDLNSNTTVTPKQFLQDIWKRYWNKRENDGPLLSECEKAIMSVMPIQIAVLSFAKLNKNDTLLFPLLAHELGHFIISSQREPDYLDEISKGYSDSLLNDIERILKNNISNDVSTPEAVYKHSNRLNELIETCLRELFADQIATRMLGFSFFAALAEFLKTIVPWGSRNVLNPGNGYPEIGFRLRAIFDTVDQELPPSSINQFLTNSVANNPEAKELLNYIDEWKNCIPSSPIINYNLEEIIGDENLNLDVKLHKLAESIVIRSLDSIRIVTRNIIPGFSTFTDKFFERINMLRYDLPPFCQGDQIQSFSEILAAGWAYQSLYGEFKETQHDNFEKKLGEYEKTCRLVLKALELLSSESKPIPRSDNFEFNYTHGVLSKNDIKRRICDLSPSDKRYLGVTPYTPELLRGASLEVRLGNRFSISRRTRMRSVDLLNKEQQEILRIIGKEKVFIPTGEKLLIHPGDFVLGATLEFLALPNDLMAFVEGKSGIGRMGLIIATASQIAPGFHGVIVLELANTGTIPLEIGPGLEVAQLVFQTMTEPLSEECMYKGKYYCQVEP